MHVYKKWLVLFVSLLYLTACEQNIKKNNYDHNTLLVSYQENLINYNLKDQKIQWHYRSPDHNKINRNQFTINQNTVYLPYESGVIIALDAVSGHTLWRNKIAPACTEMLEKAGDDDDIYRPLLMSQPTIYNDILYITSISEAEPCIFAFSTQNGEEQQSSALPSKYNLFAPLANKYGVFTNSTVYLSAFASKSGLILAPRGELITEQPLNAPLQALDNLLYITTERNQVNAIDVSNTAKNAELPIRWQHDYLTDEWGIKPRVQLANNKLYMTSYAQKYTIAKNDEIVINYYLTIREIEPKTGEIIWQASPDTPFLAAPQIFQVDSDYLVIQSKQELGFFDLKQHNLTTNFSVINTLPVIQSNVIEKTSDTFVYLSNNQLIEINVSEKTVQCLPLSSLNVTDQTSIDQIFQISWITN